MPGVSGSSRMFTAGELIEALRRRTRRSLRPESPPGEFPPGWRAWFAALREQAGIITGATADAIVAIFLARDLRRAPPRAAALNDWQAFTTLWRQEWHPTGADSRAQRIVALVITLVLELVLAILLLWLAYARWGGTPPPPGEEIVQVEFIGEGTPLEQGGGAPSGAAPEPQAAAPASESRRATTAPASPAPAQSGGATPAPSVATAEPVAAPPTPAAAAPAEAPVEATPAPQPLVVTQVPVPDSEFALQVPELATEVQSIEIVELPAVTQRPVDAPVAQVRVPEHDADPQALPTPAPPLPDATARAVPARQAQVRVPGLETQVQSLPGPPAPLPGVARQSVPSRAAQVAVPGLGTEVASLPMPSTGAGSGNAAGEGAASTAGGSGTTDGAPAGQAGGDSAIAGGVQGTQAGAGAGPKPGAPAGAWGSTQPGDDWGLGDRAQAGGQAGAGDGLFDSAGRVNLPPGAADGALAGPDFLETEIADLDRAGTWLKRPPIDYTPTRFDEYWMPGGTLLEEWVRRGIREVAIRIPGTSKKIHCVVSLLQLGGGCGINDPNKQDQEATARAAPEIPWKPELQEDQDSL